MQSQIPKKKSKKVIEEIIRVFKKKSSTTNEELQSLVDLFLFVFKVVYLGQVYREKDILQGMKAKSGLV